MKTNQFLTDSGNICFDLFFRKLENSEADYIQACLSLEIQRVVCYLTSPFT